MPMDHLVYPSHIIKGEQWVPKGFKGFEFKGTSRPGGGDGGFVTCPDLSNAFRSANLPYDNVQHESVTRLKQPEPNVGN
jgi:hypothetical protein